MNLIEPVLVLFWTAVAWGWAVTSSSLFDGPARILSRLLTVETGPDRPELYDPLNLGWGRRRGPRNRLAGLLLDKYSCAVCAGFDATVAGWLLLDGLDDWRTGIVVVLAANGLHVIWQAIRPAAAELEEAD